MEFPCQPSRIHLTLDPRHDSARSYTSYIFSRLEPPSKLVIWNNPVRQTWLVKWSLYLFLALIISFTLAFISYAFSGFSSFVTFPFLSNYASSSHQFPSLYHCYISLSYMPLFLAFIHTIIRTTKVLKRKGDTLFNSKFSPIDSELIKRYLRYLLNKISPAK